MTPAQSGSSINRQATTALVVYHHGESVCCQKVLMAVHEKGAAHDIVPVSLEKGEQLSEWFRAINPRAILPAVQHGGRTLIESTVICEYVDEAFVGPALKPDDAYGRAQMRLWTKQVDEGIHSPHVAALSFTVTIRFIHVEHAGGWPQLERRVLALPNSPLRQAKLDVLRNDFEAEHFVKSVRFFKGLMVDIDHSLARHRWLAGDRLTLADIGLMPYMLRLSDLQMEFLWAPYPRIATWLAALQSRPAYATAVAAHRDSFWLQKFAETGANAKVDIERIAASV